MMTEARTVGRILITEDPKMFSAHSKELFLLLGLLQTVKSALKTKTRVARSVCGEQSRNLVLVPKMTSFGYHVHQSLSHR